MLICKPRSLWECVHIYEATGHDLAIVKYSSRSIAPRFSLFGSKNRKILCNLWFRYVSRQKEVWRLHSIEVARGFREVADNALSKRVSLVSILASRSSVCFSRVLAHPGSLSPNCCRSDECRVRGGLRIDEVLGCDLSAMCKVSRRVRRTRWLGKSSQGLMRYVIVEVIRHSTFNDCDGRGDLDCSDSAWTSLFISRTKNYVSTVRACADLFMRTEGQVFGCKRIFNFIPLLFL